MRRCPASTVLASTVLALTALVLLVGLAAPRLAAEAPTASGISADLSLDPATSRQSVDISSGPAIAAFHGQVDLTKQSVGTETIKLSVTGTGWDWEIAPETVTAVLGSRSFDFSGVVTVPSSAAEGDYSPSVEVAWDSIDGLIRLASAPLSLKVLKIPFTLYSDVRSVEVDPGRTALFDLTVVASASWGGTLDCLMGGVTSDPGGPWVGSVGAFLNASRLELSPGEATTFQLEVDVPANATGGTLTVPVLVSLEDRPDYAREIGLQVQVKGVPVAPPPTPSWLSDLPVDPWLLLGIIGLSVIVGMVGVLGGTEVGLLGLLWFLLPLFTRLRHREVLNQFTRGEIYGFIKANPGASLTAVRENLDLSNGVVAYHLRVLLREEFIVARREGGYKRFYPRDMQVPRKRVHFTRLQIDIVDKVARHPGIAQASLAAMLSESKQVVSYNLKVLVAAGVVRVEHEGSKTRCYLVEGASVAAEEGSALPEPEVAEAPAAPSPMRWQ